MLGMFGFIKKELKDQGKLPLKYQEIPESPITDSCFLYVDALNNTGSGYSANATTWKNLMGGTNGTKMGSASWEDQDHPYARICNSSGWKFMKHPQATASQYSMEAVFSICSSHANQCIMSCTHGGGSRLWFPSGDPTYDEYNANPNMLEFRMWYYKNSKYTSSGLLLSNPLEIDKKVYVALTYSNSIMKMFINGNLYEKFEGVPASQDMQGANWCIGYEPNEDGTIHGCGADIKMYSARIHTRSLTLEEIQRNYLYEQNRYPSNYMNMN